jgi:hypothetical protein
MHTDHANTGPSCGHTGHRVAMPCDFGKAGPGIGRREREQDSFVFDESWWNEQESAKIVTVEYAPSEFRLFCGRTRSTARHAHTRVSPGQIVEPVGCRFMVRARLYRHRRSSRTELSGIQAGTVLGYNLQMGGACRFAAEPSWGMGRRARQGRCGWRLANGIPMPRSSIRWVEY